MQKETLLPEEDFSSLPLSDKLPHKVWKARILGYEELCNKWKYVDNPAHPDFKKYLDNIKAIPNDSNAAALDAGYNVLKIFIENADLAIKIRKEILPLIIEKGLISTRTSTKQKAIDLIVSYAYIDHADPIIDELMVFFDHKQPKLVAAAIQSIFELINNFGIPPINIKRLCKEFGKIFGHADKSVRAEAVKLAVEIYRWIGKQLLPLLDSLKPIQLKELTQQFESMPKEKAVAQRKFRQFETQNNHASTDTFQSEIGPIESLNESAVSDIIEVDPLELVDPVNISDKIPENFYTLLTSKDWKERKEALETLLPIIKVPKISNEPRYNELISQLAKRITDVNINVTILSANCIEHLAHGLRSSFVVYQSIVLDPLFEKCKERKPNVLDALRSALDAIFTAQNVLHSEFIEKFKTYIVHKNPQVKAEVSSWIHRGLCTIKKLPIKNEVLPLCELFISSGIDDGSTEVRDASFLALAALIKIMGEKVLGPHIEKIDKLKLAKIMELKETIKVNVVGTVQPKTSHPPAVAPTTRKNNTEPVSKPRTEPPPKQVKAKPVETSSASRQPEPLQAPLESCNFKYSSNEDCLFIFAEIDSNFIKGLDDSLWKTRLTSVQNYRSYLNNSSFITKFDPEGLVRCLLAKPSLKDSNIQVIQEIIECFQTVFLSSAFTSENSLTALQYILKESILIEKASDAKLKQSITSFLSSLYAEKYSWAVVASLLFNVIATNVQKFSKNFKLIIEILRLSSNVLNDGPTSLAASVTKCLFETIKLSLQSTNASVRAETVVTLISLRNNLQSEQEIRKFIDRELSGSIKSTVETELTKNPVTARKTTETRSNQTGQGQCVTASNSIDAKALFSTFIQDANNINWKTRKDALDNLKNRLSGQNINCSFISEDLLSCFRSRFSDSNKNLIVDALDTFAVICASLRNSVEPFGKYLKGNNQTEHFLHSLIMTLADIKQLIRQSAIKALDALLSVDIDKSMSALPQLLFLNIFDVLAGCDSPFLRKEAFTWLSISISQIPIQLKCIGLKESMKSKIVLSETFKALLDRNLDVRKSVSAFISTNVNLSEEVEWKWTMSFLKEKAKELKPDCLSLLDNIILVESTNTATSTKDISISVAPIVKSPKKAAEPQVNPFKLEVPIIEQNLSSSHITEVSQPPNTSTFSNILESIINAIRSEDFSTALSGYRQLASKLPKIEKPPHSKESVDDIIVFTNSIVDVLLQRLEHYLFIELNPNVSSPLENLTRTFHSSLPPMPYTEKIHRPSTSTQRHEIYTLVDECCANLLLIFLDVRSGGLAADGMALRVDKRGLLNCIRILISALVLDMNYWSSNGTDADKVAQLIKQLNIILVKVLENSDRDAAYSCLLSKLESTCSYILSQDVAGSEILADGTLISCFNGNTFQDYLANRKTLADVDFKFVELLMKCLWRLTRSIPENIQQSQLNIREILRSCNSFLLSTSPYQWKQRVSNNKRLSDMPLRTIKTILHELSIHLNESYLIEEVTRALGPDWEKSMVAGYIRFMLEKKQESSIHTSSFSKQPEINAASDVQFRQLKLEPRVANNPEDYQAKLSQIKSAFLKNQSNEFDSIPAQPSQVSVSKNFHILPMSAEPTSTIERKPVSMPAPNISVTSLKERLARIKSTDVNTH